MERCKCLSEIKYWEKKPFVESGVWRAGVTCDSSRAVRWEGGTREELLHSQLVEPSAKALLVFW